MGTKIFQLEFANNTIILSIYICNKSPAEFPKYNVKQVARPHHLVRGTLLRSLCALRSVLFIRGKKRYFILLVTFEVNSQVMFYLWTLISHGETLPVVANTCVQRNLFVLNHNFVDVLINLLYWVEQTVRVTCKKYMVFKRIVMLYSWNAGLQTASDLLTLFLLLNKDIFH